MSDNELKKITEMPIAKELNKKMAKVAQNVKESKESKEPNKEVSNFKGFFTLIKRLHEESVEKANKLKTIETTPPNFNHADCCSMCKHRYLDGEHAKVFCTKHYQWICPDLICDDFKAIADDYIDSEGEPSILSIIVDLANNGMW